MSHFPQPLGDDWLSWDPADLHNYPFGRRERETHSDLRGENRRKSPKIKQSRCISTLQEAC